MAREPCTFKQRDVTQALRAAMAAGIKVARYEIDKQGKIVVIAAQDDALGKPAYPDAIGTANRIVL